MRSNRAIILFVRDGAREAAIKPLPERYRPHGYDSINRRVAARVEPLVRDGADLIVVSDGAAIPGTSAQLMQRGDSFGERLGNGIADTLALGYESVLVIGNDCPTLAASDLASAFEVLDRGARIVAAPTRDGGAFLIGVRRESFAMSEMLELPWCTARLFTALTALDGAAALPIVRDDFDTWSTRAASDALALLFGHRHRVTVPRVVSRPIRSSSRMKALSRIYLPAPPIH